jgi:hypothetical protein
MEHLLKKTNSLEKMENEAHSTKRRNRKVAFTSAFFITIRSVILCPRGLGIGGD